MRVSSATGTILTDYGEDVTTTAGAAAHLRAVRPGPGDPWIVWRRELSHRLGLPVGQAEADSPYWKTRSPSGKREDARPAREMYEAGLRPGQAEAVYRFAIRHKLWERGYGSPYSAPAMTIRMGMGFGWSPKDIRDIVGVYSPSDRLSRLAPVYARRVAAFQRALGRLAGNGGYRSHTLARLAARLMDRHPGSERWRLVLLGALAETSGRVSTREAFWDALARQSRCSTPELYRQWASPVARWRRLGIDVRSNTRAVPSDRTPAKTARILIGEQHGSHGENLIGDEFLAPMVMCLSVYGRQAPVIVREVYGGSTHDAGQLWAASEVAAKEAGAYILRHRKILRGRPDVHEEIRAIVENWDSSWDGLSWSEAFKAASSAAYVGIREDVAEVAAECHMSQRQAEEYQAWLRLTPKNAESLPKVEITSADAGVEGDWRFVKLAHDDPRGPVLGLYTDCCQHPLGEGSSCAMHGWMSALGAFYMVTYRGRIVAQSWAWRSGDTVCMDNIETLGSAHRESILRLYRAAAHRMLGWLGIRRVTVGVGYDDAGVLSLDSTSPAFPMDYSGYRDSEDQRLLAEVRDA